MVYKTWCRYPRGKFIMKTNLEFENEELKKIILEMFETDKSITKFRILQISGREN